ncbi:MAG: amino acid ABC transporter permease [Clostridia bacterium]|nr:amino acid ABC transporter permease [Clostridia bacterium]
MNFIEQFLRVWTDYGGILFEGLGITLIIAFGAVILGFLIGVICALIRIAPKTNVFNIVLDKIVGVYITVIRGTPTLLQLLIMCNSVMVTAYSSSTNLIVPIIAFGINSGAYMAEVIRSGISAVDVGQTEAGRSLGLSWTKTMNKIVIPQAVKTVVPAIFNEIITLVKETSVVCYVAVMVGGKQVWDLLGYADKFGIRTSNYMAFIVSAAILYLAVVLLLTLLQKVIEKRLKKNERDK